MSPDRPRPDRLSRAVALSYDENDVARGRAPRIVASGQGAIAEAVIARARSFGVPVHESPELVAALMEFDLDQRIPPALYVAVAEVLTWAYRLEHRLDNGGERLRDAGKATARIGNP
jgi:flagellar biosynthesis protein